jgi:hypothetical protein
MKAVLLACLCGLLLAPSNAVTLSPITRVVELLKALAIQVEKEGKTEEGLYEDFVCWGKSIISQKEASNAAAAMRITELETYIADLEAGRIELTDERANLEKDIATLMSDMESAKALREKEHADFLEAEDEMNQAITALESAIETLDEATKDHKDGVLLAMRAKLKGAAANGGMAALMKREAALTQAVKLGERFLAKADATFLRRVLLGDVPDVPKADWKKLNRKATFKMKYKARSFKIQDTLKKLHQTFELNLAEATKKENEAQKQYEELSKAKQDQLDAARDSLAKMESENGARGMSKQDAQDELDGLKEQVIDDTRFIEETKTSLEAKKKSWAERSELRAAEIAAINKGIYILHNDDARDLFKKSFASQAPGEFLQVVQSSSTQMARAHKAVDALREAARRSGDARLFSLAAHLAEPEGGSVKEKFGPVIEAIDKMVKLLQDEENKDLETKETCEEDRMANTREAIVTAREIDDYSDEITKLAAFIKECEQKIEELKAEYAKTEAALTKATQMRKDENVAWQATDKDDKEAAATVEEAKAVLEQFYSENGLVFTQKGKKQPVTGMAAGEAPPPPPATWEGGYGGKTGEAQGIVSIMQMVHEDIVKDRSDAKADEAKARAEYEAFKKDSEEHMKTLEEETERTESDLGDAETKKTDTTKERSTSKGKLNAILDKIKSINPNCEYFEVNYVLRRKNRQIEIDGLLKAKAILEGGVFDAPDPNREIKPGDAFLQRRK